MQSRGMVKIWVTSIFLLLAIGVALWYVRNSTGLLATEEPLATLTPLEQTSGLLIGLWQSSDDEKSFVVFNVDRTTTDIYDGEELGTGTWQVTEGEPIGLQVTMDAGSFGYSLQELNETTLTMTYLARGNTLRYVRVNPEGDL